MKQSTLNDDHEALVDENSLKGAPELPDHFPLDRRPSATSVIFCP